MSDVTGNTPGDFPGQHFAGAPSGYPAGVRLFRQDGPVGTLYLIDSGVVSLARHEGGRDLLIEFRVAGWLLGVSAAVLGGSHPLTATTFGVCVLRPVAATALLSASRENAGLAAWLLRIQALEASDHATMLGVFGLSSPRPRLEHLVTRLVAAQGVAQGDGSVKLSIGLTHEELAEAIGASRECVTRALGDMCREGLFQRSNGWLVVPPASPLWRSRACRGAADVTPSTNSRDVDH